MRYFFLLPALVLDVVQFLAAIAFIAMQFATPIGLGAATGVSTAYLCWSMSSGILSGLSNAAQCLVGGAAGGAILSAFAIPIGLAFDVALSVTVGGALVVALAMSGMFYPKIIISRMLGEVLPFINFLPIWSNMIWKCIQEKKKEEAGGATASSGTFKKAFAFAASAAVPGGGLKAGAQALATRRFAPAVALEKEMQQKERQNSRVPLTSRFADIRPAAKGATLALLFALGLSFVQPQQAHAQSAPAPVQYIIAPETPGAHETVLIEAQGVGSFLGSAKITWSQNGVVVRSGVGERTYSFTTGALGERTTIKISIDSSQGFFSQTFIFSPSRINLVWEADTTIPPLYLGKARYSAGSNYKVVAFPTVYSGSSRITPDALSYQWFYRGEPVPEASGLGRAIFSRTGDQLQSSEEIAVDVYYGVSKVGRAELSLAASEPMIVFYQRDALRGVLYDQALPGAISLVGKEITIQAEPFFFASATKKSGLIPFVWTLDDTETAGPDSARGILTLRQAGSGTGSATLGLAMQNNNPDQFVQTSSASLRIEFGAQQTNPLLNFFGL